MPRTFVACAESAAKADVESIVTAAPTRMAEIVAEWVLQRRLTMCAFMIYLPKGV
jgi:hypothetical protein